MRPTQQGELLPRMAVILANRDDLPLAEVVRRHRAKQGHENAFKGPLVDMDLHHPPCRGYRANQAFYAYGQMAHCCCARCSTGCCRRPPGATASARWCGTSCAPWPGWCAAAAGSRCCSRPAQHLSGAESSQAGVVPARNAPSGP